MLPLSLLRAASESPMLVELKSGETYNGRLINCDAWMNINLRQVICTSRDGTKFWKMSECYIRGSSIKYFRLPDSVMDAADKLEHQERMQQQRQQQQQKQQQQQPYQRYHASGRGGRSSSSYAGGRGREHSFPSGRTGERGGGAGAGRGPTSYSRGTRGRGSAGRGRDVE